MELTKRRGPLALPSGIAIVPSPNCRRRLPSDAQGTRARHLPADRLRRTDQHVPLMPKRQRVVYEAGVR